jgi:hypothetical protein
MNNERYIARHKRTQREFQVMRTDVFNMAAPIGP